MFHDLLIRPLFNALVFIYESIGINDLGIAIILLTIVIRLILYPLFYKSYKNQILLQKIQPKIKKIQHDHKDNREKQAQELLGLYKQHKVNPFSGIFLIIIQLPILIALFQVFRTGITPESLSDLYDFIPMPEDISNTFLGLIDLIKPNIIIVGLTAIAQYLQGKLTIPKPSEDQNISKAELTAQRIGQQMVFIAPVITVVVLYRLPAAIGIYWLTTSLFSLMQQYFAKRSIEKKTILNGGNTTENKNIT